MRSADLARLAGVTVRALRHYHQVGVLAEPPRAGNGYRRYDVHDLVRVLRIRRLAALGIPLERMPALLDDGADDAHGQAGAEAGAEAGASAARLLDELDRELAEQIDRLVRQREVVAHLRAHRAAPDLPPELAPAAAAFAAASGSPELVRVDRDQAVLVSHLVGEEGAQHLAEVFRRLSAHDVLSVLAPLSVRFARLDADTDDAEVDEVVDGFVEVFGPVVAELATTEAPPGFDRAAVFLAEHSADVLGARQREVLARLQERLERVAASPGRAGPGAAP
ncbi:MerR family transcriptional regulator [Isoptericola sp. NPDC057391]|uniref:MerR family transcriptional regulator n=1 Tax=Isoptericola sp. NPDC057391 TaxID=3346117 RepID=UPI003636C007